MLLNKFKLIGNTDVRHYRSVYLPNGEYSCMTVDHTEEKPWQMIIKPKKVILWDYASINRPFELELVKYEEKITEPIVRYSYYNRLDNSGKLYHLLVFSGFSYHRYIECAYKEAYSDFSRLDIQTWDFDTYYIDLHFPFRRYSRAAKEWHVGNVIVKLDTQSKEVMENIWKIAKVNKNGDLEIL